MEEGSARYPSHHPRVTPLWLFWFTNDFYTFNFIERSFTLFIFPPTMYSRGVCMSKFLGDLTFYTAKRIYLPKQIWVSRQLSLALSFRMYGWLSWVSTTQWVGRQVGVFWSGHVSSQGLFCAPRKPANPCHPLIRRGCQKPGKNATTSIIILIKIYAGLCRIG